MIVISAAHPSRLQLFLAQGGLSTIAAMTDMLSMIYEYALPLSQVPVIARSLAQVASVLRADCLSLLKLM